VHKEIVKRGKGLSRRELIHGLGPAGQWGQPPSAVQAGSARQVFYDRIAGFGLAELRSAGQPGAAVPTRVPMA